MKSSILEEPGFKRTLRSRLGLTVIAVGALFLGVSCTEEETPPASTATASTAAADATATGAASGEPAATEVATAQASTDAEETLVLLTTAPETGYVGTAFTISGEGLPAGEAQILWGTKAGSYHTELNENSHEFYERQFVDAREEIGRAPIGEDGRIEVDLVAPEDFGGAHDIYIVIDGADVAKGGFWIDRQMVVEPLEGPVGTPLTVTVTGLGWKAYESTGAIRWDNQYTGFVTATTTRGTARAEFRAAGSIGDHLIELYGASHALPYLNVQQSPVPHVGVHRATFRITDDTTLPQASLDWPDPAFVAAANEVQRPTVGLIPIANVRDAHLSADSGPVRSTVRVESSDLPAGQQVDLVWITVLGSRIFGWVPEEESLGQVTVDASGTLSAEVEIPESLGGWHVIRVVADGEVFAELPYFVERSLATVTPQRVKAGETFTVQMKGVGWTELDNGVAVTYDNSYIGYACGFASNGDVTIEMVATGSPGIHLIDLYPMIYDGGHGKWPWQYNMPHLTYAQDHPSLALGYRLPTVRVAIEVVE